MPLLLLLLAGGSDLARIYVAGIDTTDAARNAALYASHHPGYGTTDLTRVVSHSAASGVLHCPTYSVSLGATAAGPAGTTEQSVTVTCSLPLTTGILHVPSPMQLATTVTVVVATP